MPRDEMPHKPEIIKAKIEALMREVGDKRDITYILYREDYMDYQITLEDKYSCEIREKLVDLYIKDLDKEGDAQREIRRVLQTAVVIDTWEKEAAKEMGEKIDVEDKEKYDF
ncbi:MAG: hypothetical protein Q8Q08_08130 [Candidatus Omnitrophota bacterium]|nr:hypothetical protein [Candidatus Omnitrophota bacterium]MDZ4242069.1 hypothetical protein [Candidatus Omnitrophota bacterium]